ncbi:hypothetical protein [Rhizobium sp. NLR22b]|uniref:hypothetical protein n=1 Tax=Rhizobium sp. NLR22b TaxID=2731115 RepID=UPI001C83509D|nr:hypothetical protein [Rhizobium sp. NLR22b]MBX5241579.1 hypothetical protein [Rhizobium sp. NLR22b]
MLTPVRAASNASFSSQGQTAAIVAGSPDRSVIAPAPVNAVEATELNSAIAGKLNILLLAARERMVEALFDVIDAAGRSISLDRGEDESNSAFASRLADAIRGLPTARIDEVEGQLSAQGHSLPLRTIAEALKNPTGPEAARIIAYLEIVRYKDRDLAARAVVRSYGQNDASPMRAEARPEIQLHEASLLAAIRQPAETQSEPAGKLIETALLAASEEAVSAAAVEAADPEISQSENWIRSASVTKAELAPKVEARQSVPAEPRAGDDTAEVTEPPVIQPLATSEKADPLIPRNWTGILASMTEAVSEMIVTIIREQDVETVQEDGPVEAAVEVDAILDEAVSSEAKETLTRQPADLAAADARQSAMPHLSQMEPGATAAAARQPKEIAAQPQPMPLPDMAEASYVPLAAKVAEGFAYAQLPYQFAKDTPSNEKAGETSHQHHHHQDGAPQDEQQAQSGGEDAEPDAEGAEAAPERRTPRMIDTEPSAYRPDTAADPVYALYQRMAGWE